MATEIRTRMIGRCRRSSATKKLASGLSACQFCDIFEEIYQVSNGFLNRFTEIDADQIGAILACQQTGGAADTAACTCDNDVFVV